MITEDVDYHIHMKLAHSDDEDHFVNMNEFSNSSEEVQKEWVERITDYIWGSQNNSSLGVRFTDSLTIHLSTVSFF